jgi:hypothetical protein
MIDRSNEMTRKGAAAAERFGIADHLRWLTAEMLWQPYWEGRWDEAALGLNRLIPEFESVSYWMETPCRWLRGRIRLGQGDSKGAHEDAARALERARVGKDPQVLWPSLSFAARACLREDPKKADALAHEVLAGWQEFGQAGSGSEWLADSAIVLERLGKQQEFLDVLSDARSSTPWLEGAAAYVEGHFSRAAEVYRAAGALPDEAYARLRAAKALVQDGRQAEGDVELERSLAFWRMAGASAYVREGEALLAASA